MELNSELIFHKILFIAVIVGAIYTLVGLYL